MVDWLSAVPTLRTIVAAILTVNIGIVTTLYVCWLYDFSDGRVTRSSFQSPSRARMPGNKSHAKERRVGLSITLKSLLMRSTTTGTTSRTGGTTIAKANAMQQVLEGVDEDTVVERLGKTQQHLREADTIHERMANRDNPRRMPNPDLRPSRKLRGSWGGNKLDLEAEAARLDMDHVALTFWDFVSALYLIGPSLMLKEFYGLWFILYGRRFIFRLGYKLGIVKDRRLNDDDARKVVGELVLDTVALPIYLTLIEKPKANTSTTENGKNGRDSPPTVATFTLLDIPLVKNNGDMYIAKDIIVKINLDTRSMIQATMGGRELTPLATYTILVFHVENGGHPKIHALSNWSINVESRVNKELRWNSVVTTIYNWFGYCGYARVTFFLRMLGLFQPNLSNFQEMVDHVLDQGVPRHGNVSLLVKYSPTVKFVSRMRTFFLQEFAKHKKDFPGIDGEALFMNTVMHSLDHGLLGMINRDILWVDENDPEFGGLAQAHQLTRACFVTELPLLPFRTKLKDMRHPFYQSVYQYALELNPTFARELEACIIR